MLNVAIITGRVTKDIEIRKTETGKTVTNFTLACDRDTKDAEGNYPTDFIECTAWGFTAEMIAKNFYKGKPMEVTGRIQDKSWKDKEGKTHKAVGVVVERVNFVPSEEERGRRRPAILR